MTTENAIQKIRDVVRLRHLSISTEETYCHWIRRFSRFLVDRKISGTTEQKMEAFLTQLARQDVSASTQNQAFCALLFFYREVLKMEIGDGSLTTRNHDGLFARGSDGCAESD
jgi:site-specific recombinase XerD